MLENLKWVTLYLLRRFILFLALINANDSNGQTRQSSFNSEPDSLSLLLGSEGSFLKTKVTPLNKSNNLLSGGSPIKLACFQKKSLLVSNKHQLSVELYKTSLINPRVVYEPQYLRIQGSGSFNVLGIPLLYDGFYTSESNSYYTPNYFSFKFDLNSWMSNQSQNYQQRLNALLEKRNDVSKQLTYIDSRIRAEKNQLSRWEKLNFDTKNELNTLEFPKYEWDYSIDSLRNWQQYEQTIKIDSVKRISLAKDTALFYSQIISWRGQIDSAEQSFENLKKNYLRIDSMVNALKAIKEEPWNLTNSQNQVNGIKKKSGASLQKIFSKFTDFEFGMHRPSFSKNSLWGTSVKGLQLGYQFSRMYEVKLSIGKTSSVNQTSFNRRQIQFDRNLIGVKQLLKLNSTLKFFSFMHLLKDGIKVVKGSRNTNLVIGVGTEFQKKQTRLEFEIAQSHHRIKSVNPTIFEQRLNPDPYRVNGAALINAAASLKAKRQINQHLELEAIWNYVGMGFKNLANPFLRTNFNEYQLRQKSNLFKNQIQLITFYKHLSDNPLKYKEVTNIGKGYGLQVQSRFKNKKIPNFTINYSPYEQGNNHPDSLFRINNQFALLQVGINHLYKRKKFSLFQMIQVSRSKMEQTNLSSAEMESIGYNSNISYKKVEGSLSISRYYSLPEIDSSNFAVYQLRMGARFNKHFSFFTHYQQTQYNNGAFRKAIGITSNLNIVSTILSISLEGFEINRLWGIDQQRAYNASMRWQLFF